MGKVVNEEFDSATINLIGTGTIIQGDINCNGDIRINGTLNGNLNTKGRLIVGEAGRIKGEISCKNADILGFVEGKMTVTDLLSLKSSSTIIGEVSIGRISIEPGCKFNGTCKMNEASYSQLNDKKPNGK